MPVDEYRNPISHPFNISIEDLPATPGKECFMKKPLISRLLPLLLILSMLISLASCGSGTATSVTAGEDPTTTSGSAVLPTAPSTPTGTPATETPTPEPVVPTVVIAGSDFQNPSAGKSSEAKGSLYLTPILEQIRDYYDSVGLSVNGLLFGGDYNYYEYEYDSKNTLSGITTLRNTVHKVLGDDLKEVFIQGNHDAVCDLIASTGAHDTAAYGVFVVNEDDYQQGDMVNEELNKAVAAKMRAYFSEKAAMNYSKPIFVCSHVPLHTTARPSKDFVPGDAKYAQYLFDVLNEFGDRLNIIFLYGHDHSNGWDSYLGGSSVYLKPGDKIHVLKPGSRTHSTEHTLTFTYMNYGYTGYYWFGAHGIGSEPNCDENDPADNTLTMTSFEIVGDTVTVRRWSAEGQHALKYPGQWNLVKLGSSAYEKMSLGLTVNETRYESGQVIRPIRPSLATDTATGVSVAAYGKEPLAVSITASLADVSSLAGTLSGAKGYQVVASGAADGALYQICFPAAGLSDLRTRVYIVKDGTPVLLDATVIDGKAVVYTDTFGTFVVGELTDIEASDWQFTEEGSRYLYTLDTDGPDQNAHYIIVAPDADVLLPVSTNGTSVGGSSSLDGISITVSADGQTVTTDSRFNEWITTAASGSNPIKNGTAISGLWYFRGNNYYLKLGSGTATTFGYSQTSSRTDHAFTVRGDGQGNYQIIRYYPTNYATGELWYNGAWTSYRPTLYNGGDFSTGYPDGFNGVGFDTPAYANYEAKYVRLYKFAGIGTEKKNYYTLEGSHYTVSAGTESAELIDLIRNTAHVWYNSEATLSGATDRIGEASFTVADYTGEAGNCATVVVTVGTASFTVSVTVQ